MAQIEDGVDVIYAERLGAIEAAAERDIAAIGNLADQGGLGSRHGGHQRGLRCRPDAAIHLERIEAGTLVSEDLGRFSLMRHGGAALASYGVWADKLPEDLMRLVAERRLTILDGRVRVIIDESDPRTDR